MTPTELTRANELLVSARAQAEHFLAQRMELERQLAQLYEEHRLCGIREHELLSEILGANANLVAAEGDEK